jgi:hypothetical protein
MATSDIDVEQLISELSASLLPFQRTAFETAARAALVAAGCSGCGAAYRLIGPLQRAFWDPPPDDRLANAGARHRGGKLADGPPIGEVREDRARRALCLGLRPPRAAPSWRLLFITLLGGAAAAWPHSSK